MIVILFIVLFVVLFFIFIIPKAEENKESIESVTTFDRGTASERALITTLLRLGIPSQDIFHDLYVKTHTGHFSQIDLVVLTDVGIIVVEVKDYSGWIFGSKNRPQWTKVLAYGKEKYYFYNPIIQNNNHILALRKQLGQFKNIPCYSLIVFYGDCKLKNISSIPQKTYISKASKIPNTLRTIIDTNRAINYDDKNQIIQLLKNYVENGGNIETRKQHIKNVTLLLEKNNNVTNIGKKRKIPLKKNIYFKILKRIIKILG